MSRRAIGSRVHVLVQQTAETCVTTKVLAEVNAVVSVAVATAPDIADLWIVSHNSNLPYPSSGFVPSYLIFRTTPCRTVHVCVMCFQISLCLCVFFFVTQVFSVHVMLCQFMVFVKINTR